MLVVVRAGGGLASGNQFGVTLMRFSSASNVRLSERRASIGFVILIFVSLGLLGAQTALGTAPSESGTVVGGGTGGGS